MNIGQIYETVLAGLEKLGENLLHQFSMELL